jgi:hypothetical protein
MRISRNVVPASVHTMPFLTTSTPSRQIQHLVGVEQTAPPDPVERSEKQYKHIRTSQGQLVPIASCSLQQCTPTQRRMLSGLLVQATHHRPFLPTAGFRALHTRACIGLRFQPRLFLGGKNTKEFSPKRSLPGDPTFVAKSHSSFRQVTNFLLV